MSEIIVGEQMTIGQVVDVLAEEFENISISKIRYLENEGLVRPQRTKGGYRKFSEGDLATLRAILVMQNHDYLPLSVIRERLRNGASAARDELTSVARASDGPSGKDTGSASLKSGQICQLTGIDPSGFAELEKYGVVSSSTLGEDKEKLYGAQTVALVEVALELGRFGVEPRHLRQFANFAGREITLCRQALGPISRRTPDARHKARSALTDISGALGHLRELLVRQGLEDDFKDLA